MERDLELVLLADGGAELLEVDAAEGGEVVQVWASDTDETFMEEFPELLDENDVERVLDYLVQHDHMTEDEANDAEVSTEALGPGDEDDDDDEDGDGDFIEKEALHA